jgi:hypothetical protein
MARLLISIAFTCVVLAGCGSSEQRESETRAESRDFSQLNCDTIADLRGFGRAIETAADLQAYVKEQRELLRAVADETPERELHAGVTFKTLLQQAEVDAILNRYGLQWMNINWEAPSGDHGAISRSAGQQTINGLANGAAAYYVSLDFAPAEVLEALADEQPVYLVDVGRIRELDAADARRECIMFALPDPLWYLAQRLNALPE